MHYISKLYCNCRKHKSIITNSNAVNDASKFMKLEKTLDTTNRYFGTYTFFINDALPNIADIASVVAPEKKLNTTCPLKI